MSVRHRRRTLLAALACAPVLPSLLGGCAAGATTGGTVVARRDPALWPFSSDSPWNTALGSGARYTPVVSDRFDPAGGGVINTRQWSHPVHIAQAGDPTVGIYRRGESSPVRVLRVPEAAQPDRGADGSLHIIDVPHRSVVELWKAERIGPDRIVAAAVIVNSLTDTGLHRDWHGARAYGGSALGGLIRRGELTGGIPHVLAAAVHPLALNRLGPDGRAWVWPASSADDGDGRRYGTRGNLHMGTLLALPPAVDLQALGLHPGPEMVLGRALQDFGACIVDSAASHVVVYAEPGAHDEAAQVRPEAMQALIRHLQVVANHTPASIGGGGQRRAPPAPPLA